MKSKEWHESALTLREQGMSSRQIGKILGKGKSSINDFFAWYDSQYPNQGPRILIFDLETSPILGNVWALFQQNVGLNQIERDWYILSYCAKWYGDDKIFYNDKSDSWDTEDDINLLEELWQMMDQADIVVAHNALGFDVKKLNARFVLNGMKPPSGYKVVDTLQIAKSRFRFTSNKLEYLTDKLCTQYKKLKHGKYPGFELWKACLQGDQDAWDEMFDYNVNDVLSLEELFNILRPWDKRFPNINLYYDDTRVRCRCGSHNLTHNGYSYTGVSKFDRFQCDACGAEVRGRVNLLSKQKRETLLMNAN